MGTTVAEALDFYWNHKDDWTYQVQFRKLSSGDQIAKIINDYIVYIFASILGISASDGMPSRKISPTMVKEYKEYVSQNSYTNLQNESVILVLNGE